MSNKDIFNHFKEEADKIREVPSSEAWSRIEQRLYASRPAIQRTRIRTIGSRLHPMSIAAGIALILGLIVVFMWMTDQQKTTAPIAQTETLEWEELSLTSSPSNSTEVIAIATSHPQPVARKPIAEGNLNQRLIAKQDVRVHDESYNSPADSARSAGKRTSR